MLAGSRVLLVISGGIAAYKSLELIRRLRERGCLVRCVLTEAACEFITPLSAAALSEEHVYTDLFSLTDESEMGHIQLSRSADLVVVAPATADLLAKQALGLADDLASTVLLATTTQVLVAPAMNVAMWQHPATQQNIATLEARGVLRVGPGEGDLACGETGSGRMAEVVEIVAAVERALQPPGLLSGVRALVTSGPTHEAIDPVRYLANRSSGKQGHAVAAALAAAGADTVLVSGPTRLDDPPGCRVIRVTSAREMLSACEQELPVDVAVCAAAVADWRPAQSSAGKIKKSSGAAPPAIRLVENPDILHSLASRSEQRPRLVVGFAAETEAVEANATRKRERKGCDWIVANDVSAVAGTFGGDENAVWLITADATERWPKLLKSQVAERLVERIAAAFASE